MLSTKRRFYSIFPFPVSLSSVEYGRDTTPSSLTKKGFIIGY